MTFIEMEQIINKPFISSKEVAMLANCNIKYAQRITKEIREELTEKEIPYFHTRQSLVPTEKVVKKLKLNPTYIRKQAREMRNAELTR